MQIHLSDNKISFINICLTCNNNCLFCPQDTASLQKSDKDFRQIRNEISAEKAKGSKEIHLLGGEPTLNPKLMDIIAYSKKNGFEKIILYTNGRMLKYRDFCVDLKKNGLTDIVSSLHGSSAKIHDLLTGATGSFKESAAGIINAKKTGIPICVRTAITKPNSMDLPNIAELIYMLGASGIILYFTSIYGNAEENAKWLTAKYSVAAPFILSAMKIAKKNHINSIVNSVPICVLQEYTTNMCNEAITDNNLRTIQEYLILRQKPYSIKKAKCGKCKLKEMCSGIDKNYAKLFGTEEISPIMD